MSPTDIWAIVPIKELEGAKQRLAPLLSPAQRRALIERAGVTLGVRGAGSVVGEVALLRGARRTATVTAITDMTVLVVSRAELATMRYLRIASTAWDDIDRTIEARLELTRGTPDWLTVQPDVRYFPCAPIIRTGGTSGIASRGACS